MLKIHWLCFFADAVQFLSFVRCCDLDLWPHTLSYVWNTESMHQFSTFNVSLIKLMYSGDLATSNFDNNNIYFAKGQVHQKGKSPSKLTTILTATKENKKLSYRWQTARCCFVKLLRYCRTFCLTRNVWLPDGWKNSKIYLFVLTWSTNVTDGRTDRHRMTA